MIVKNLQIGISISLFMLSFNSNAQIAGPNGYLIGNYLETGIAGAGGYEGADTTIGVVPGIHWRSDFGNPYHGFVADPLMTNWVTFDGDFFTPGSPENGWGLEIGGSSGAHASNNCSMYQSGITMGIPGSISSYTSFNGCLAIDWDGNYVGSGYDISVHLKYKLKQLDTYYTTEVTITNNGPSTIDSLFYYRNVDPDNNEVLSFDYTTNNTIVSQPLPTCEKALVSATQATPAASYMGFGAIGMNFRVTHGGFSNRDASNIWYGTGGLIGTVGSTAFMDEAISLAYLVSNIAPGASETFKFVVILDAAQVDLALANLFYFDYNGAIGGPPPECVPDIDTALTCVGIPITLNIAGQGVNDFNWSWSPPTGLSVTTGLTVDASPPTSTTYYITGTPINPCYTAVIDKIIVVDVSSGPLVQYTDPGPQCGTFDLTTLIVTDLNGVPGTVTTFNSAIPDSATDFGHIWPTNYLNQGDSVWVAIADTVNGCFTYALVDLTWGGNFAVTLNIVQPTCGVSNGSIEVTSVLGGIVPYSYSWAGGPATPLYDSLAAGIYTVTITDNSGCSMDSIITLVNSSTLTGSVLSTTDATCGMANGSCTIIASGGTTPYTFNIGLGAQSSGTFLSLLAGAYVVSVLDSLGCIYDVPVSIIDLTGLYDTITAQTNVSCFGGNDGSITFLGSGGTSPYLYDIGSAQQSSGTFNSLTAGIYTGTFTDSNGCTYPIPFTITEPTLLTISVTQVTDALCYGSSNGAVEFSASGGTPSYSFDIGGASQATGSFTGLVAGNYTGTVTDANGCNAFVIGTINEPLPLTMAFSTFDAICNAACDGYAVVIPSGGTTPYSYNWSNGATNNATANNLCAGNYNLTVTDNNGCVIDTLNFAINEPAPLVITNTIITDEKCYGDCLGSITILAPDATLYSINNGFSYSSTPLFDSLCDGSYILMVEDAAGCHGTDIVDVISPPIVNASFTFGTQPTTIFNPMIIFTNNSSSATNYSWSFGDGNTSSSFDAFNQYPGDAPGQYTACLYVSDAVGCVDTMCKEVIINDEFLVYVPDAFTPNGDGVNDLFLPILNNWDPKDFTLLIFNRWGEMIFKSDSPLIGWDGTYRSDPVKEEVYVWKILTRNIDNHAQHEYIGHVALIR